MDTARPHHHDDGTVVLRVTRPYRGVGMTVAALATCAVVLGTVLAGVPAADRLPALAIAVPIALGLLAFVVQLWNRRIVLDGDRVGFSNGLQPVGGWVDLTEVVDVALRDTGDPRGARQIGLVLFASRGGARGPARVLARMSLRTTDRARIAEREEAAGRLHPLALPLTELDPARRRRLGAHLEATLPAPVVTRAHEIVMEAATGA